MDLQNHAHANDHDNEHSIRVLALHSLNATIMLLMLHHKKLLHFLLFVQFSIVFDEAIKLLGRLA